MTITRPDGTQVTVTSERINERTADAIATLEDAKELRLPPRKSPFMAVLPYSEEGEPYGSEDTYLVDSDTDRIHRRVAPAQDAMLEMGHERTSRTDHAGVGPPGPGTRAERSAPAPPREGAAPAG
ncbi:hypothetical protein AMK26_18775 [Streptomyces sp. CB03234]|nr:hypothetical protein AMK26_18775 [Streptomyces sp. CB03234]